MMNGLSAGPFLLLLVVDVPISFVAFGVLFTGTACGILAVVLWFLVGTSWWYLLGRFIDGRLSRKCGRRGTAVEAVLASESSPVVRPCEVRRNWGAWLLGTLTMLAVILVVFTFAQNALEKVDNGGAIRDVIFSPDGQTILLSRSQRNSQFLYKVELNSGVATRLTKTSSGFESSSSYSPDGRQIAFTYAGQRGELARIFVVDANGGNSHPLFPGVENVQDFFPRFAANGKICFARSAFFGHYSPIARSSLHEWDLYTADPDGQNLRPLTNQRFYGITAPSLSSDGKKVLFFVNTDTGSQIQIYSLGSEAPAITLTPHVANEPRSPIYAGASLTPDGGSIVFLAASEGSKAFDYDVFRLDLASNVVEKLTTANGYATNLSLSNDGKTAAFLKWSSRFGRSFPSISKMYLLDLTTKRIRALPITGTN